MHSLIHSLASLATITVRADVITLLCSSIADGTPTRGAPISLNTIASSRTAVERLRLATDNVTMRLLDVNTLRFTEFYSPNIPKYAIASHRWIAGAEAMLDDVQERKETHRHGYRKVKGFAAYVMTQMPGVKWLWIDTCCIDQRNSPELSEAITSAFRWYRDAEVCLAYLRDVPTPDDTSSFEKSSWFKRGWTLQELLAPATVIFLTRDWELIGHKGRGGHGRSEISMRTGESLDSRIAAITHIPEAILQDYRVSDALSVEEKLDWMKNRQTTKEEDSSYCLLGILGVSMTIRYGDGKEVTRERLLKKARSHISDRPPQNLLPRPFSNVPFRRDPHFVERVPLTDQIRARLSVPAGRVALVGLGGVGKSQLAIQYAWYLRQQSPQTWVFWIHASNATRFEQSVGNLTDELKVGGRTDESEKNSLRLLRSWLRDESKGNWLIVLDNADDVGFLLESPSTSHEAQLEDRRIDYIPACNHGSVIITSRSKSAALQLAYETDVINVLPMSEDEAAALLENKLGQPSPDYRQLVRALDCMPLALTQAAAYIRERTPRCSVQQYREELEHSRASRSSLLRHNISLPDRDREASNSVMLTWQVSFEHLYQTQRSAADLLSVMSFCDRLAIPEALLRADYLETVDSSVEASDFESDIAMLRNLSFVSHTTDSQTWEMHRLIQDATQVWLKDHERFDEMLGRFVHGLSTSLPAPRFENWSLYRVMFPHAVSIAEQMPASESVRIEWASVMHRSSWYAAEQGDDTCAAKMAEFEMAVLSELLGANDVQTLCSTDLVAQIYRDQGRWAEAEQMLVRVVGTYRAQLGSDHLRTLFSMHNLAIVYMDLNRWGEAEELLEKVSETLSVTLEPDHLDVLSCMADLAVTYQWQGRLLEAEQLQVKLITAGIVKLGPDKPLTLSCMGDLAATYQLQGRLSEAEQLQLQLIETWKVERGPDHPNVLASLHELALTYQSQGRWDESEHLLVKVVEVARAKRGPDHPSALDGMVYLANTYYHQGRLKEARALRSQVVDTYKRSYGPQHPCALHAISELRHVEFGSDQQSSTRDRHENPPQNETQRLEPHWSKSNNEHGQRQRKPHWRWLRRFHSKKT